LIKNLSKKFKEVNNPVWDTYKGSNGFFETYYFLRFIITRGKAHPQIVLSMMGEYALVMLTLNYVGISITAFTVFVSMMIILVLILVVGYLDVYFNVARKENSFSARFSPEQQTLFRKVDELHNELIKKR